jgi:nucleoside-diphosphate-sugar epimerase
MKLLILGSEGFIGRHCVEFYLSTGKTVSGADLFEQPSLDYSYYKISRLSSELEEVLAQGRFDALINAAGSGNVPYSMTHPLLDFEANCLDTIKVLEAIRKYSPDIKYIHLSSAAVYGNPTSLPVVETQPLNPLSPYGYHKMIAEQLCIEYTRLYTLSTAIVRPFSIYGPGLQKQMFWDIYKKTLLNTGTISLWGTGKESRDYLFVKDMVLGLDCILRKGKMEGEVYNLASGEETSIEVAVKVYLKELHINSPFQFNGVIRSGDPLNWHADITNLKRLGFTPATSLEEGLKKVANWTKSLV